MEYGGEFYFHTPLGFAAAVGGLGYAHLYPYPVGVGRVFYARAAAGRMHWVDSVRKHHFDLVELGAGFRIPTRRERPADAREMVFVEVGAARWTQCADWDMPCTQRLVSWVPNLSVGMTM